MRVVDVMTTEVETAHPEWSLKQAARAMIECGVSGLPVVADDGTVVGIITEADFIEAEADRAMGRRRLFDTVFGEKKTRVPSTVGAVMTKSPFVVDRNTTVSEAARLMTDRNVKRIPVVDPDGRLEGIVSRGDVLVAFARDDDVIADAVERGVIRRILMLDSPDVSVRVADGVVTLTGEVPTRTDARLLEELVRHIEGVVRCDSDLSWSFDDVAAGPTP
ncbi:MAG: CBS domain-containing protein [Actinomycetota bacterium]|nr:CBS domain-containing protein [Actinomycetota bacterium]